jgi:hypothetical protein
LRSFAFSRLQDDVAVHAEGKGPVVLVLDGVDAAGPFRARFLAARRFVGKIRDSSSAE